MIRGLSRLWNARGFFGGLAAVGLAMLGQQVVLQNRSDNVALLYYLAAIAVLIASLLHPASKVRKRRREQNRVETIPTAIEVASPSTDPENGLHGYMGPAIEADAETLVENGNLPRTASSLPDARTGWRALRAGMGRRAIRLSAGLTLVLAASSALVLVRDINNPVGGWLWAAALVALLVTVLGAKGPDEEDTLLPRPSNDFFAKGQPNVPVRWEAVLMGIILIVALALRLYNLENHPLIFGDEGERGLEGRSINEGNFHNLFGFGWWSVPNLYFYCVAWLLRLFGDNMFGDRMICVISGMVMVWFIYKTARLLWGPRAGLMAGAMMAVSPLALQFSRSASESTVTAALWTVGFYFLFMALRYRRWSDWALAGFGWGFSLYFYASSKLIVPIAAVVGLYCLLRWRKRFFRYYLAGFVLAAFSLGLVFMPNALFSIQDNWNNFTIRAQQMSITSPGNRSILFVRQNLPYDEAWAKEPLGQNIMEHPAAWALAVYSQARLTLEAIYKVHDGAEYYRNDGYHNGTMMQPLWAALTLLGLALAAWRIADARFGIALIWFGGGLLGAILTIDTPTVQRMTGAWSVVMLFPAAVLEWIFAAAWPLSLSVARRWATVPLVAVLIYFGVDAYNEYFVYYPAFYPKFWTTYARYAQALGQEYKAYQFSDDHGTAFGYGVVRFVAKGVEGETLYEPVDYLPITDNKDKGVAFVAQPLNAGYLPVIRQFYPGGKEEVIKDAYGQQQFTSYKLTREQMKQFQEVRVTYTGQDGKTITRNEPSLGTASAKGKWTPPNDLKYPAQATWEGDLVAPMYGMYKLQVVGGKDAKLELDGKVIADMSATPSGRAELYRVMAKGIHDVRLSGALASPATRLEVQWADPSQPVKPIPSNYLFTGPTGGLSGEAAPKAKGELVDSQDPFGGKPVTERRIYPIIGFGGDGNRLFMSEPPTTVRWQGTIQPPSTGSYTFDLISKGAGVLMIDDKVVASTVSVAQEPRVATGTLQLTSGKHKVDLRYAWGSGEAAMQWFWIPPGKEHALVPASVLTPLARSWTTDEIPNAPEVKLEP